MRRIITLLAILIANKSQSQQLQVVKTYYDRAKTQLNEVYTVIKNTPTIHGEYKKYDSYRNLEIEELYKNGEKKQSKLYFAEMVGTTVGLDKKCFGKLYVKTIFNENGDYVEEEYSCNSKGIHYLKEKRYFRENRRIRYTKYFENGKLFQDAPRDGIYLAFYENGNKKKEYKAVDGKAEGLFRFWHENGNIDIEANMLNAEKIGEWKEYHSNGNLKLLMNRIDDTTVTCIEYDSITKIKQFERTYFYRLSPYNGEEELFKNGIETEFFENGQIKSKTTFIALWDEYKSYKNEYKNGNYIEYYENGSTFVTGQYENGRNIGKWTIYNQDGTIKEEKTY